MQTIHGQVVSEIIESCRAHGFTDVILVHEHRGIPDGFIISHLPFGPTAYFGFLNVASILQRCFHVTKSIPFGYVTKPSNILQRFPCVCLMFLCIDT
ncbi:hypothetical protein V6Z12_D11G294200, partial [Gossypium hirsutum]